MNALRTVFLLTLLTLLLVWLGHAVGGRSGMMIALVIGLALNFFNYWFSSSLVLKAYGARTLAPGEAPALEQDVRELCDAAGLPSRSSPSSRSRRRTRSRPGAIPSTRSWPSPRACSGSARGAR